jgi:hypothetical protein
LVRGGPDVRVGDGRVGRPVGSGEVDSVGSTVGSGEMLGSGSGVLVTFPGLGAVVPATS